MPSPEDFEYAKSKGLMFDPVKLDHDIAMAQVIELVAKLNRYGVADAFLANLSTKRTAAPFGKLFGFPALPTASLCENGTSMQSLWLLFDWWRRA